MHILSFSRIYYDFAFFFCEFAMDSLGYHNFFREFTICFAIVLWIHYLVREFTLNPLSISWFYYKFTVNFAISLWILYLLREFTKNSLWIHYLLRDFSRNSPSFSCIHYESTFFPRNHYEFTICLAILLWNHYLIPEITINLLAFSRNHYEFTVCFEISQWVYCRFREFTLNPLFLAKSLWIHYLPRDFTMKSLSVSWIHFESTVFLPNYYGFTICCAKSLWIHFAILLRDFTMN